VRCPFCGETETKVLDSRPAEEGKAIRRRRECENCRERFTTYERVEEIPLLVIKKDGSREVFDKRKILSGILKACEKRPISMEELESIVSRVEQKIKNTMEKEITSSLIGEYVMEELRNIDEVAYVRFASVYRQFKDINKFMQELQKLLSDDTKS
jgi:transcriptional repressor NrdR